jgi:hypothetical protein
MTFRPLAVLALAAVLVAPPAVAGPAGWTGHLAIGYTRMSHDGDAPGGSLSVGAGIAQPLSPRLSLGPSVGYHLLGALNPVRGSLAATVDHSALDVMIMVHVQPALGPLGRVSLGAGLVHGRADLSSAGGGAAFSDLALAETAPGVGLDVTLMSSRPRPVRVGLEGFLRRGFFGRGPEREQDTWTLAGARLAFHY